MEEAKEQLQNYSLYSLKTVDNKYDDSLTRYEFIAQFILDERFLKSIAQWLNFLVSIDELGYHDFEYKKAYNVKTLNTHELGYIYISINDELKEKIEQKINEEQCDQKLDNAIKLLGDDDFKEEHGWLKYHDVLDGDLIKFIDDRINQLVLYNNKEIFCASLVVILNALNELPSKLVKVRVNPSYNIAPEKMKQILKQHGEKLVPEISDEKLPYTVNDEAIARALKGSGRKSVDPYYQKYIKYKRKYIRTKETFA